MTGLAIGLLAIRLVAGLTVAAHGSQKLFGWFDGPGLAGFSSMLARMRIRPAGPMAVLAALAELGGGLLLALGLFTPLGCWAVMSAMIVAIATVHLSKGFWNMKGGYEFPLLLGTAALAVSLTGPGAISVDAAAQVTLPEPLTWIATAVAVLAGVAFTLGGRRAEGEGAGRRSLG